MRKERSVEVVKVCTKNLFIHHHPTSTLVFVRALWSRICEILIGSRIVTHHLQREKEKRRKILLISSSLLETPTLVSFFLANVRTMMKFTKFLLLGLLIGLFAGISVPSSA
jgi:hypothetical protein